MKKVLSLILALAMVLSCTPFVFAEGEEVVIPDTFDLAEAYAVDTETHPFTGDPETDYPSTDLPAKGSTVWQVGSFGHNSGYDTFDAYPKLYRMYNYCRAYEDDKSGELVLTEGATYDKTRYPQMVWTTFAANAQMATTATTWHWQGGAPSTYGDGGYAVNDPGSYTGSLGYGFNTIVTKSNSSLGYQNTGSVHPAAIFTAPKAGIVKPTLTTNGNTNVVYQVYKKDAAGNMTVLYPCDTDAKVSIVTPSEADNVVVPDKWKTGWAQMTSAKTTKNTETVWVEEGDQIVLRFAPIGPDGKGGSFNLGYYKIDYLTTIENDYEAEYRAETRKVDLNEVIQLPIATSTVTVDEDILTAVEGEEGVYTIADSYIDGTETTITVVNGSATQTITASFKELVMVYDFGELFKTTDTYTADYVYPAGGQTAAMLNNGSQIWSAGYTTLGTSYGTVTYFNQLARYTKDARAYEDTASSVKDSYVAMSWIATNNNVKTDETSGWYCSDPNGSTGSVGYNFGQFSAGSTDYHGTSALGWCSSNGAVRNQMAIFKAPRAGVVNPQMVIGACYADMVLYRMDKIAADGTVTAIYPLPSETKVNWVPNVDANLVPTAWLSGWGVVPNGYGVTSLPTQNMGFVRVEEGDQIVLRFAPNGGGNTSYFIDSLKMEYTEQFGPDDELFLTSPMATYEESYTFTYPTVTVADVHTELANPIAAGTIEYTVTGNADVLRVTADPGVYELTGTFNIGGEAAVVTASYYAPGKSSANGDEPRFTQSTNVYVQPKSNTVDTFNGKYDIFDLSEMSYEMDEAFVIPYYSNAAEREIYGVIDLGITDEWANATATISDPTKFEYLGNGRIRALTTHTWTEAGGTQGATENDVTTPSVTKGSNVTSKRDKMSMGDPVVLTLVATDGGVRKFGLWAFTTTVQDLSVEGADPNAYSLTAGSYNMSNAVNSVEVYDAAGNFTPTYKDPNGWRTFIGHADHRYTNTGANVGLDSSHNIYLPLNQGSYWNAWTSNKEWPGWIGVAQTFTAPKDGTINLTGYFPADGYFYNSACSAQMVDNGKYFNLSVGLYDTNGTLISKVWQQKYGTTNKDATSWGRLADTKVVDEDYATVASDDAETLTIKVEKGQKIRVMIDTEINNYGNYTTWGGNYAIKPVWTYNLGDLPDMFEGDSVAVTPTVDGLTIENVFTFFYDEKGELINVSTAAYEGSSEDGYFYSEPSETVEGVAYAKVFFWDSLSNIKPLAGDITVRK